MRWGDGHPRQSAPKVRGLGRVGTQDLGFHSPGLATRPKTPQDTQQP